jgi:hypothetical protein
VAPWADVLYAGDARWWEYHWTRGAAEFAGHKYALQAGAATYAGVHVLQHTGDSGVEREPTGLRTGRNSGYAAVNLAVHLGATRVLLLGYDMQAREPKRSHFFGDHPKALEALTPYGTLLDIWPSIVAPLQALGVTVINCSRETALTCFPRMVIGDALAQAVAA